MLTREQWENAAKFACVALSGIWSNNGTPYKQAINPEPLSRWQPDTDWRDFGPLSIKLMRWASFTRDECNEALEAFEKAVLEGTEKEAMKAGCQLAAAIGATMKEESICVV